jgi:hypothetical protein
LCGLSCWSAAPAPARPIWPSQSPEAASDPAQRLEQAVQALRAVAYRYAGAPSSGDLDIITAEQERVGKELAEVKALPPADPALAKIITALPAQVEKLLTYSDQLVSSAASTEASFTAQVKTGIKLGDDSEALRSEYQASRSGAISTAAQYAGFFLFSSDVAVENLDDTVDVGNQ